MSRSACWAFLLLITMTAPVPAQALRGRLVTPAGEPMPGALVTLVHESGTVERVTVSDARGAFTFEVGDSARFTVLVERPGFLPDTSAPLQLQPGRTATTALVVDSSPRTLGGVRAFNGTCQPGAVAGHAADVWRQATLGLAIMALAEEAGLLDLQGVRYLRLLDSGGDSQYGVLEQEAFAGSDIPYPTPPAPELPPTGFSTTDAAGGSAYQVPSPAVLLSPSFLEAHCIHRILVERRRNEIGLAFRPVPRSGYTGIEGVLWLDRASGQLRSIDYQYQNSAGSVPRGVSGEVGFSRGRDGLPVVSRWAMRIPRVFETSYSGGGSGRTASTLESGVFVLGPDLQPLDDPKGVFTQLAGVFTLDPISVEAERAQRAMTEGALRQIRLDEMPGAPPTDALAVVSSMRPGWLARAQAWRLTEESGDWGGDCVVYLDRMRWSSLQGDDTLNCRDALAQIPTAWIASIEYVPPIESAAIYGQGHGYGVIVIRTRRR